MQIWRLTKPEFYPGLDGEGSRLWGGTWNSPGMPMVYFASSLALATLEVLVNLPSARRRPGNFPKLLALAVDLAQDQVSEADFPALQERAQSQEAGDAWLRSGSSLGMLVPSRVIPLERNVLLNPRHAEMSQVSVILTEPFVFDDRLSY